MCVDVVDVSGLEARELDGARHRVPGLLTVGVGRHHVVPVRCDACAHQSRENVRAACLGVLLGLDDQQRTALAEHEAVAVPVERPTRAGRVIVGGGQHDSHLGESCDRHRFDPRLDTTADRDVGFAEHDLPPRVGDALGTRCASRNRRDDTGFGFTFETDGGCRRVRHVLLHGQRGNQRTYIDFTRGDSFNGAQQFLR